jgi:enoyl reductase
MRQRDIGMRRQPRDSRHCVTWGRRVRRGAASCALGALLLPAILMGAAGSAAAGPPPPGGGAGCGGASCWTWVFNYVSYSGNGQEGGRDSGLIPISAIPPPSCWMQSWMTAAEMYNYFETYIAAGNTGGGAAWAPFAAQIIALGKANAPGEWWGSNFDGSLAGSSCVGNLPLIQWVPPGAAPPIGNWLPPRTLAWLALSRLIPAPPRLTTNPAGDSYVDLPTFVTATIPRGNPLSVTASVPGESETVVATPLPQGALVLDAPGGTAVSPCGASGSAYSAAQMAATGPGGAIDCGVTYAAPSTGGPYPLSGTLYWQASWNGQLLAPPPALPGTSAPQPIVVAEVQSINRGKRP